MSDLLAYIINPSPETLERQERMWAGRQWALLPLMALMGLLVVGCFMVAGAM